MPADIAALYHRELAGILQDPAIRTKLEQFSFVVAGGAPDDLKAQVIADQAKWKSVVAKADIKP